MFKRVGSLIQYGLLATLLIFGFVNNWGAPQIYTYLSVIVLGIVLGLLFLIYNIKSMTFPQKLAMHLGFSALAILIVAIFNGWLIVNWDRVFTAILIICGLALLIYFGYQYSLNSRLKGQEDDTESLGQEEDYTQEGDFDLATGQVVGQTSEDRSLTEPSSDVKDEANFSVETATTTPEWSSHESEPVVAEANPGVNDEDLYAGGKASVDSHTNEYQASELVTDQSEQTTESINPAVDGDVEPVIESVNSQDDGTKIGEPEQREVIIVEAPQDGDEGNH